MWKQRHIPNKISALLQWMNFSKSYKNSESKQTWLIPVKFCKRIQIRTNNNWHNTRWPKATTMVGWSEGQAPLQDWGDRFNCRIKTVWIIYLLHRTACSITLLTLIKMRMSAALDRKRHHNRISSRINKTLGLWERVTIRHPMRRMTRKCKISYLKCIKGSATIEIDMTLCFLYTILSLNVV